MLKRAVATVFAASLTVFGLAPAAGAATSSDAPVVKIVKVKQFKPGTPNPRIEWDAPAADDVVTILRAIDWD